MSNPKNKIKLFDERQIRSEWDAEAEKWWFSVVDIVAVLTDLMLKTWSGMNTREYKQHKDLKIAS